ncbi:MAG: ABC transporter permease [Clostridia bacterium]|nr:ABC transporter permease [Clostridia bacterium]
MNILTPTFFSLKKNRKTIIYIVSLSLILALFCSLYNFKSLINNIFESNIKNNIKNRCIYVTSVNELDIESIKNVENIKNAYYFIDICNASIEDEEIKIKTGDIEQIPNVIYGNDLSFEGSTDILEIIIPESIQKKFSESLINKNVIINVNHKENIEALIVGIYNGDKYDNTIYVSLSNINKIIELNPKILNKYSGFVIADSYDNINKIIEKLMEYGYNCNLFDTSGEKDIYSYENISKFLSIFIFLMIICVYVIIRITIKNFIDDEEKELAIMKAIGYNNITILKTIILRTLTISIIAFLISYMLVKIINVGIMNLFNNYIYNKDVPLSIVGYLIAMLMIIVISVICSIREKRKIKKINIIELLKNT